MDRWQVIKDGMTIAVCGSIEEAEQAYCKHDADEIRRLKEDKDADIH